MLVMLLMVLGAASSSAGQRPTYEVRAIRYGTVRDFPVSVLVQGADPAERLDLALAFWLIQGADRTILFDSGFHRAHWFDRFEIADFIRPDSAVQLAGLAS